MKIYLRILLFILLFSCITIISCKDDGYCKNNVVVKVKSEYKEEFLNEAFTIEDFEYENVDRIVYESWSDDLDSGYMVVFLKKHGKRRVLSAIDHFNKLDFVKEAKKQGIIRMF